MVKKLLQTENDYVLMPARLVIGVVFFAHGAQKVLGWFGGHGFSASMNGLERMGIPAVFAFLAIAAEFAGGLGLILGFLTRVAGFGIFAEMIVAVAKVHGAFGLFMNWAGNQKGEGFEYHLLALALLLVLMARGGGALSLDRVIARWVERESVEARRQTPAVA